MTTLDDWKRLLADVEAATGPDRELDNRIWAIIADSMLRRNDAAERKAFVDGIMANDRLTASLDATAALIERERGQIVAKRMMERASRQCIDRWSGSYATWLCRLLVIDFARARIAELEQKEDAA